MNMFVDFIAMGYSEDIFWNGLSYGRFHLYRQAYAKRINEKHEADMVVGYTSACVVMAHPRPTFNEVMGRNSVHMDLAAQAHLTDDELNANLIAALKANSERFVGGE